MLKIKKFSLQVSKQSNPVLNRSFWTQLARAARQLITSSDDHKSIDHQVASVKI